ncbi:putative damage-inducible protein DinB [Inhella inkyongensis]|uniref:Putative damage-inducible protein DinB n=1 Tax=Inhella inkyongensis TaxID=392593 RepID=A0A840S831_9BURK|nr:DinB family protein [Inhella inkyongensis]MBB5205648.1 putative damage-inducible protein DinB [Inhella inkyongensis]
MSTDTLQSLFAYKAWADAELLAGLAQLGPEHADTLHASLRTLNHIHVVDRLFRAHLAGEAAPFEATNTVETPTLEALRTEVAATNDWLQAHVRGLSPAQRQELLHFRFTDGDAGCMSREEMLLHLITHGAYHRGNVGQRLKDIGIAPPRDLYTRHLHLAYPQRRTS